ncbi:CoA-disulfide reductase [Spirochaetia bacterium 38H-sp]|uniref:CoA-disulfide reductase n=1 Tax=Rarispira pelagica TaxID=3141764 RepID=A0ABU9UBL0_9SPIR
MKYLIIGGVAGGATTAARLRRLDEKAEIILFERGKYISYANCGLPYYIGGTISDREMLFVQTPESFGTMFNLEVRVEQEVTAIDRDSKQVTVLNHRTGEEYKESYDKLVLSPGAEPIRPPIPGINDERIFTLRSVDDTDTIYEFIEENKPRRAVIVGAGFIGLEMAENLHQRGLKVTIVELAPQVMNVLDFEMAAEVHQHLKTKNVAFFLGDAVTAFTREGNTVKLSLKSGRTINADFVLLSIGVRPDTTLAKQANLEIGERGGIKVNKYLQTSDPDIYAVGDAIEFRNPITGKSGPTYLAGPANKQGRIAANNIVEGNKYEYKGAIATAIAKVFDLTVASTGMPEKVLKAEDIPYQSIIIHPGSHAGYYPGAMPMTLKLVFSPAGGKILGAQIVGYDGVDKRIDTIAALLQKGGTIYDLTELEHAYAPPFSSAKDPVNMAGFVAQNILEGKSRHIQWYDILEAPIGEYFLIDVRTPEENALGTIEGSVNIPVQEIRNRLDEIPRDKKVVLFCGVGLRAYIAERILRQNGYTEIYNLSGGYKTFMHMTQKQSNEDIFEGDVIEKDDILYQRGTAQQQQAVFEKRTVEVDSCGLQCPGPIMRLKKEIEKLSPGDRIVQKASDPGFARDVESWCKLTGNLLIGVETEKGIITATIEKGIPQNAENSQSGGDGATIICFSDALDKALAALVLAQGAASAGKKTTMFFTFWGLSILKKQKKPRVKKDLMGRMFSWMLPSHSKKLALSKMNFGGIGAGMMRSRMKKKNVEALEEMLDNAIKAGVRIVACQMSMDVMGVTKEELIDGAEIGGVATYMEAASKSNVNLFI